MTPLERAARALAAENGTPWEQVPVRYREAYFTSARAVISALREPGDAMWSAGRGLNAEPRWHALIDALLEEGA